MSGGGLFSRPRQKSLEKLVDFLNEWIAGLRNWQVCWHIMDSEIGFFGDTAWHRPPVERLQKGCRPKFCRTHKLRRWSWKSLPSAFLALLWLLPPPPRLSRRRRRRRADQEKISGDLSYIIYIIYMQVEKDSLLRAMDFSILIWYARNKAQLTLLNFKVGTGVSVSAWHLESFFRMIYSRANVFLSIF